MSRIKIIHQEHLRNDEAIQYNMGCVIAFTQSMADEVGLGPQRAKYAADVTELDGTYKLKKKYNLTKLVQEKHKIRNDRLLFICNSVDTNFYSGDATKREAAQVLKDEVDPYRSATKRKYFPSITMVRALCNTLKGSELTPQINALGLSTALTDLETANEGFQLTYDARSVAIAKANSLTKINVLRQRVAVSGSTLFTEANTLDDANEIGEKDANLRAKFGAIADAVNGQAESIKRTRVERLRAKADANNPDNNQSDNEDDKQEAPEPNVPDEGADEGGSNSSDDSETGGNSSDNNNNNNGGADKPPNPEEPDRATGKTAKTAKKNKTSRVNPKQTSKNAPKQTGKSGKSSQNVSKNTPKRSQTKKTNQKDLGSEVDVEVKIKKETAED